MEVFCYSDIPRFRFPSNLTNVATTVLEMLLAMSQTVVRLAKI